MRKMSFSELSFWPFYVLACVFACLTMVYMWLASTVIWEFFHGEPLQPAGYAGIGMLISEWNTRLALPYDSMLATRRTFDRGNHHRCLVLEGCRRPRPFLSSQTLVGRCSARRTKGGSGSHAIRNGRNPMINVSHLDALFHTVAIDTHLRQT